MEEFLATVSSFPTVVFGFALGASLVYWLVVIFGALDLDVLDSALGLDTMDAAFDGAVESLEGAADGALDGAAEAVEGADALDSAEPEHDGSSGGLLAGLLNTMGVRGVPLTVVGTAVTFWAFVLSYLATRALGPLAGFVLVGAAIGATACLGALVLGAVTTRPLKKLFVTQSAPRRATLVGKMCTVLSARVDSRFGRAEIDDGGAGFVAEVRCSPEHELARGAQALVYRYEPKEGIFYIGPVDAALTEANQIAEES